MRAIMVMYDSLNRHYLPNYGGHLAQMPNFQRLGERTVTFDNSYVGSLPCMPARRELHTGRLNFLHRGWTPLEPFDDSMPEILKKNGFYSHLVSDHQHYWEDGGATYHSRYNTWEFIRGQEGDIWKGDLRPVEGDVAFGPKTTNPLFQNMRRQDLVNRSYMTEESQLPQPQTFAKGLEFMETNKDADNWFLQIETFDPHEPFFTPDEFQALYREEGEEPFPFDWPPYGPTTEPDEFVEKVRKKYLALLSMCDKYMGKFLDTMDRLDLWKDTMVIVNTDHGYLLGEHLWWAKAVMPTYNELAHTPLFIWDPRCGAKNQRCDALVQTIDLAPTLLDFFGLPIPKDMQGIPLGETLKSGQSVRDYALFGFHASHVNVTDGRWLYMRAPLSRSNRPLHDYTLMPNHMRTRMQPEELQNIELVEPFSFTKGVRTLRIPAADNWGSHSPSFRYGNKLFDLEADPGQLHPVDNPEQEVLLINEMARLMRENDAPSEQFQRMGIPEHTPMTVELLMRQREERDSMGMPSYLPELDWEEAALWQFDMLMTIASGTAEVSDVPERFRSFVEKQGVDTIGKADVFDFAKAVIPQEHWESAFFTMEMISRLE